MCDALYKLFKLFPSFAVLVRLINVGLLCILSSCISIVNWYWDHKSRELFAQIVISAEVSLINTSTAPWCRELHQLARGSTPEEEDILFLTLNNPGKVMFMLHSLPAVVCSTVVVSPHYPSWPSCSNQQLTKSQFPCWCVNRFVNIYILHLLIWQTPLSRATYIWDWNTTQART